MTEQEIDRIYKLSDEKIADVSMSTKRSCYQAVNWKDRLISIKGPRGVGKTTLLLQKIVDSADERRDTLYLSLDVDWPSVEDITAMTIRRARKMMRLLAALPPQTPKMKDLYVELGTERQHGLKMLYALERARLLKLLPAEHEALDDLTSPEKIYLDNPNMMYALVANADIGTARECFFANQLAERHTVAYPKRGDFLVDDRWLFEVGGKGKSFDQIKDISDSFVVNDGVETTRGNKIPLWLFGFLY